MVLGPLMIDVEGYELTPEEFEILQHPLVGGVILFTRNYNSPQQVKELIMQIRQIRDPQLLIAVDQEGGRVQRFREGFTQLPALSSLGQYYDVQPEQAKMLTEQVAWLMAIELLAVGVDFSFAPVLDLAWGASEIIGTRSLHKDPHIVAELGLKYISGMQRAGMATTGKHFPGHGYVAADSHTELPIDKRDFATLVANDIYPFRVLIQQGLNGIMPAHIIYSEIDDKPAGFSSYWLSHVLRQELKFTGVIFSDDLSMAGAAYIGSYADRAEQALAVGCDMVLVCNNRRGVVSIIDNLSYVAKSSLTSHLLQMRGKNLFSYDNLKMLPEWCKVIESIKKFID